MQELLTFPTEELKAEEKIFVSLTLDVEPSPTGAEKDMIQFDNLVKEAKEKVIEDTDEETWEKVHDQISHLKDNRNFWKDFSGGMVFYITPNNCYYYLLDTEVGNTCYVAEKPNILPLIRDFQFLNHYQVLALNNDGFKLFNGRRFKLQEVELEEDAPNTIEKALGT